MEWICFVIIGIIILIGWISQIPMNIDGLENPHARRYRKEKLRREKEKERYLRQLEGELEAMTDPDEIRKQKWFIEGAKEDIIVRGR